MIHHEYSNKRNEGHIKLAFEFFSHGNRETARLLIDSDADASVNVEGERALWPCCERTDRLSPVIREKHSRSVQGIAISPWTRLRQEYQKAGSKALAPNLALNYLKSRNENENEAKRPDKQSTHKQSKSKLARVSKHARSKPSADKKPKRRYTKKKKKATPAISSPSPN